jgi:hypothetical protein
MKLLLLRCPQCNQALSPGQDDRVVQCPNCRSAVMIDEGGLAVLPAQYVAPTVTRPPAWLPFWVYRGQVTIRERKVQMGRSSAKESEEFWAQPRRVYIPAWACELSEARELVRTLLEKQPALEAFTRPESEFVPAVITTDDARKLLELVVVSIEANRKDWMEKLDFDLRLEDEALWLFPAERRGDEWQLLLRKL